MTHCRSSTIRAMMTDRVALRGCAPQLLGGTAYQRLFGERLRLLLADYEQDESTFRVLDLSGNGNDIDVPPVPRSQIGGDRGKIAPTTVEGRIIVNAKTYRPACYPTHRQNDWGKTGMGLSFFVQDWRSPKSVYPAAWWMSNGVLQFHIGAWPQGSQPTFRYESISPQQFWHMYTDHYRDLTGLSLLTYNIHPDWRLETFLNGEDISPEGTFGGTPEWPMNGDVFHPLRFAGEHIYKTNFWALTEGPIALEDHLYLCHLAGIPVVENKGD